MLFVARKNQILLKMKNFQMITLKYIKSVSNKFLLTGDTFMRELHLKQPKFTDSACGLFTS